VTCRHGVPKCSGCHRPWFGCLAVHGLRGSLSLAGHWCHCNFCGKDRGICVMRTVCVGLAFWCDVVYAGTYVWLDVVFSGVLAACVELGSCYNPVRSACRSVT
jgi:hypothetical protein